MNHHVGDNLESFFFEIFSSETVCSVYKMRPYSRKYKLKKDLLYFPEMKTNCYSFLKGAIVNRTYAPFSKWKVS